jgi:hypothetical protein
VDPVAVADAVLGQPPLGYRRGGGGNDRALPDGEGPANVDGLAISPNGLVFLLDPTLWSSRFPVTVRVARVWHGSTDVTGRIDSTRKEARAASRARGVPVTPLVAIEVPVSSARTNTPQPS